MLFMNLVIVSKNVVIYVYSCEEGWVVHICVGAC